MYSMRYSTQEYTSIKIKVTGKENQEKKTAKQRRKIDDTNIVWI